MELPKEFVVGDYYNICCRDCEVSLNFGKKMRRGEAGFTGDVLRAGDEMG